MDLYSDLKIRYFTALETYKANKGSIRAYVGLHTLLHEIEDATALTPVDRHINAFCNALNDLEKAPHSSRKAFDELLHRELSEWRSSKKDFVRKPASAPIVPPPIHKIHDWHENGFTLVSLFSGAFGLDLGFLAAGFNPRFATDIDHLSFETAKRNLPETPYIHGDFNNVSSTEVLEKADRKVGEVDVLIGGPPCQPFSTAGQRQGFNDPRSSPLKEYIRLINDIKPRAFLMEEVPGLLSSRLVHIPIAERGKRDLLPEEQEGSVFNVVISMLQSTGYKFVYGVLNAADYGAPQVRDRLIIIGLRDKEPTLPTPTHKSTPGNDLFSYGQLPWSSFWEAVADLDPYSSEYLNLAKSVAGYMEMVPPGGHWRQLPQELIPSAMGGAYESGGGKMGFYRRFSWDDPAPTVVTSPLQKATIMGHPELDRPLTIQEYKRVQGFPDDWYLPGKKADQYKLIGNAVSVHFSCALAKHIIELLD